MPPLKCLVICGFGTNCQLETAHAARLAGFDKTDIAHFSQIARGETNPLDYQLLIFPGGFQDGDRLGAAQAAAVRWRFMKNSEGRPLLSLLADFLKNGGLILGVCNGFQLLVKLGILPGNKDLSFSQSISLGWNDSGKFEDRWTYLAINPLCPSVFTKNLPAMRLPARHGEGKIVASPECLADLEKNNLIAMRYADPATKEPTMEYPWNPNGSPLSIAGLSDFSGRVLGLMPHPEAFHHVCNHPGWTRGELDPPGTLLFANAAKFLRGQSL